MGNDYQKENASRSSLAGAPVKNNFMRSTNPDIPRPALEKHPESAARMRRVMIASDWKVMVKGTLRGFFTIQTASGLRIYEVMLHERDGKRWITLPAKPWTKADGTTGWTPIFDFKDSATKKLFQEQAIAAIDAKLAELAGERHEANP